MNLFCTCGGVTTDGSHAFNCPMAPPSKVTVIGPAAPESVPTGWQCPGCKRYNAPSVLVCSCVSPDATKRTLLG